MLTLVLCFSLRLAALIYKSEKYWWLVEFLTYKPLRKLLRHFLFVFPEAGGFHWAHRQMEDPVSCSFLEHMVLKETS